MINIITPKDEIIKNKMLKMIGFTVLKIISIEGMMFAIIIPARKKLASRFIKKGQFIQVLNPQYVIRSSKISDNKSMRYPNIPTQLITE
jgi:hypothetical protein